MLLLDAGTSQPTQFFPPFPELAQKALKRQKMEPDHDQDLFQTICLDTQKESVEVFF